MTGARLPPTREVLGFEIAVTTYEDQLTLIDAMVAGGDKGYFCHAAVNTVMNARRMPRAAAAVRGATLTLPDGMPLVWALRALGERIEDRIYGPDMMLLACEHARARHFLYGGRDEDAARRLAESLRRRFPEIELAGRWTPPFRTLTAAEERDVAERIDDSGADIVWVGTGSPRQEIWMRTMRDRIEAPVLIGVGAAFDIHSGMTRQAPAWMQRHGLEWLHRLSREPHRLGPRYLRDNPAFAAAFARQRLRERRRGASR
ncbi:MAG TPA: WecB/TagA/CpsF family glycosyltransferase [Solirubrobacterales bacterium]|nr:WecB/TagA/CpsF family glycosyltransferase [Solirubrobacterales bacterium]